MALFQKSVLTNYLKSITDDEINSGWEKIQDYQKMSSKIREFKEEAFQAGFLTKIFVDCLGYKSQYDSADEGNLFFEEKNVSDGKKADGAIKKDNEVVLVIELKGTNTKDLKSVETQAFGYKANHPKCEYVVTSNFEKLRFYIENAVNCEEFDLFNLSKEDYRLLHLCLHRDNIFNGIPKKLKNESVLEEESITKKLYKDYSAFRNEIFNDLINSNPEYDKLLLFNKTQKLLDRFLFIFFGEDRRLLPANSISEIIKVWVKNRSFYGEKSLYDVFKGYFKVLNIGRPARDGREEIYAYNGGLFADDEVLNKLKIDDNILLKHTKNLSHYDFESDISVNILGHIFEHSLSEIEEIQNEIAGSETDTSKRKKDGVFYTPQYITKYIVKNTVGKLCQEKKAELEINDEVYTQHKARSQKRIDNMNTYREWLLGLTICDPACGSGAFLVQALNFLIEEHKYVNELTASYHRASLILSDITSDILENNLFGVDINEESVEIAKLSLWLRTAQEGRKLTSLNSNLKCGNSLIDDPEVAGDRAFNWQNEFPDVFAKGGFDVVIGNPPYVNANELKKSLTELQYKYLKSNYTTAKGTVDLYIYFFEKGIELTKEEGILSYITPNRFLSASYGKALRELLISHCEITSLIDYSDKAVFPDASTYPVISFLQHKKKQDYTILTGKFDDLTKQVIESNFPSTKLNVLDDSILGFLLNDKLELTEKVINQAESLKNIGKINATSTAKEADDYSVLISESEVGYKLINTGTIDPYCNMWGKEELTDSGKKLLTPYLPKDSMIISDNRHTLYSKPKIIISKIGLQCEAFLDSKGEYASINTNCFHSFSKNYTPEYILCWVNSKLYNYTFECFFDGLRMSGGYLLYSAPNLKNTYIKNIDLVKQKPFIKLAKDISSVVNDLNIISSKFTNYLLSQSTIIKLSKKLQNWYELEFGEFIKELNKAIKKAGGEKLPKMDEIEWMEVFETKKAEAQKLKAQINQTDKEIDAMVYALYGLTKEEIEIVENS